MTFTVENSTIDTTATSDENNCTNKQQISTSSTLGEYSIVSKFVENTENNNQDKQTLKNHNNDSTKKILTKEDKEGTYKMLKNVGENLLDLVGEDRTREGLIKTPHRFAESMLFLTKGYQIDINELVNGALFDHGNDDMVIIREIDFFLFANTIYCLFSGK